MPLSVWRLVALRLVRDLYVSVGVVLVAGAAWLDRNLSVRLRTLRRR